MPQGGGWAASSIGLLKHMLLVTEMLSKKNKVLMFEIFMNTSSGGRAEPGGIIHRSVSSKYSIVFALKNNMMLVSKLTSTIMKLANNRSVLSKIKKPIK